MYPPTTHKSKRASALLVLVITLGLISGMLSLGVAKINAVSMNSADANKVSTQAHNLALNEAALVRATDYTSLKGSSRTAVSGTAFEREVVLSDESDYTSTIKSRTATINVYKGSETLPRAALSITRYSVEQEFSGVPVGTVIAWAGNKAPNTNGIWLECNGQSCAAYPALVAVLGKSTVPDYRGRFLESATSAGTVKEAGLPNITGTMDNRHEKDFIEPLSYADSIKFTGAFYNISVATDYNSSVSSDTGNTGLRAWGFDASRSNKIYGKSTTVQPASVTVRRFIKAA